MDFECLKETFDTEKLISVSKRHVDFLLNIHEALVSQNHNPKDFSPNHLLSLNRYVKLWLPLVLKSDPEKILSPPVDIAWLWHVHRLCPTSYVTFCNKLVEDNMLDMDVQRGDDLFLNDWTRENDTLHLSLKQTILLKALKSFERPDSVFSFTLAPEEDDAENYTVQLWKTLYPCEPFHMSFVTKDCGDLTFQPLKNAEGLGFTKYRILDSAISQRSFAYQVHRDYFKEDEALHRASSDYLKFLKLIKNHKQSFNVPRFDIDLMWHTHMTSSPMSYAMLTMLFTNSIIGHDDSEQSRESDSKLIKGYKKTCQNWYNLYAETYEIPACNFLGPPPVEFWLKVWKSGFKELRALRKNLYPFNSSTENRTSYECGYLCDEHAVREYTKTGNDKGYTDTGAKCRSCGGCGAPNCGGGCGGGCG